MLVFPRTFKFKTPHNLIFRRIHFVASVHLVTGVDGLRYYEVVKLNGATAIVPYSGTVVLVGRKVNFSI
jgi:hypothetical protein